MKKTQKLSALFVSVVMLFSCLPLSVAAQEKPLHFVALGDSIVRGDGIYNSEDACYARIVADTNGYTYANHAVNGSTSANLLEQLQDERVIDDIKAADIINISIGGNDFLQQNVPLLIVRVARGNFKNIDDITEMLAENYAEAIATIKAVNPDAVIIAQTLYNPRIDALRGIYGVAVDRVNQTILAYAEQNPGAIHVMDVRPVFEGRFDYVAADTIHPSASGNAAIARLLLQTLSDMGLGENTQPVIKTPGIDEIPFSSEILGAVRTIYLWFLSHIASLFAAAV